MFSSIRSAGRQVSFRSSPGRCGCANGRALLAPTESSRSGRTAILGEVGAHNGLRPYRQPQMSWRKASWRIGIGTATGLMFSLFFVVVALHAFQRPFHQYPGVEYRNFEVPPDL